MLQVGRLFFGLSRIFLVFLLQKSLMASPTAGIEISAFQAGWFYQLEKLFFTGIICSLILKSIIFVFDVPKFRSGLSKSITGGITRSFPHSFHMNSPCFACFTRNIQEIWSPHRRASVVMGHTVLAKYLDFHDVQVVFFPCVSFHQEGRRLFNPNIINLSNCCPDF